MDFTEKLVHYSNTSNKLIGEYNQLYGQIWSVNRERPLVETCDEVRRILGELRNIQQEFKEQYVQNKEELHLVWNSFALKLEEHIESAVEHTYVVVELITFIIEKNTWQSLWNLRKLINMLIRFKKLSTKCTEKGEELNLQIKMIQNLAA